MCKFDQYLHTSHKSGINVYAICVGWVNFVHNLRCLLKNLRSQQKFYATAGPTGPDKYELCVIIIIIVVIINEFAMIWYGVIMYA